MSRATRPCRRHRHPRAISQLRPFRVRHSQLATPRCRRPRAAATSPQPPPAALKILRHRKWLRLYCLNFQRNTRQNTSAMPPTTEELKKKAVFSPCCGDETTTSYESARRKKICRPLIDLSPSAPAHGPTIPSFPTILPFPRRTGGRTPPIQSRGPPLPAWTHTNVLGEREWGPGKGRGDLSGERSPLPFPGMRAYSTATSSMSPQTPTAPRHWAKMPVSPCRT